MTQNEDTNITVRDLLKCAVCDIGISFGEDPSEFRRPDLMFQVTSETSAEQILSKELLDSKIHLMEVRGGIIHATVLYE